MANKKLKINEVDPRGATQSDRRYRSDKVDPTATRRSAQPAFNEHFNPNFFKLASLDRKKENTHIIAKDYRNARQESTR